MKIYLVSAFDKYYPTATCDQVKKIFNNELSAEAYAAFLAEQNRWDYVSVDDFDLEEEF